MKDLYLVGAGGMGREVLNIILDIHVCQKPRWNIIGFLDDTENPLKDKACDYGVVGTIKDYKPRSNDALLMCIASPHAKQKIATELKAKNAFFDTLVAHATYFGRHSTIGEGAIIYGGVGMSVNCKAGNFVTLLNHASLGHDVTIGDYCTVSSRCSILGNASIGNRVFLGDSSLIAPNVIVEDDAYVGIGSVVVKKVKAGEKVFGNPAREIGI